LGVKQLTAVIIALCSSASVFSKYFFNPNIILIPFHITTLLWAGYYLTKAHAVGHVEACTLRMLTTLLFRNMKKIQNFRPTASFFAEKCAETHTSGTKSRALPAGGARPR
jgi:hypothetical protein